jgi:hypothetical protein
VWGSYGTGGEPPVPLHWIILEACGASDLGSNPSTGAFPDRRSAFGWDSKKPIFESERGWELDSISGIEVPSKPLIDRISCFEHFEIGAPLKRASHSSVTSLDLETPPPRHFPERLNVQIRGGGPRMARQ